MSDAKDPIERQKEIEAIQARYSARDREVRPSIVPRLVAILLLIFVAPFLLFAGYCGLATFPNGQPIIGPVALLVFGALAFVTHKRVHSLWLAHEPESSLGWVLAFVALAFVIGCIYVWATQALGWRN